MPLAHCAHVALDVALTAVEAVPAGHAAHAEPVYHVPAWQVV